MFWRPLLMPSVFTPSRIAPSACWPPSAAGFATWAKLCDVRKCDQPGTLYGVALCSHRGGQGSNPLSSTEFLQVRPFCSSIVARRASQVVDLGCGWGFAAWLRRISSQYCRRPGRGLDPLRAKRVLDGCHVRPSDHLPAAVPLPGVVRARRRSALKLASDRARWPASPALARAHRGCAASAALLSPLCGTVSRCPLPSR